MHTSFRRGVFAASAVLLSSLSISPLAAQTAGSQGTVNGTVTDASGAVVPGATVTIANPISHLTRQVLTDAAGHYKFSNLSFSPYHLTVVAKGFTPFVGDVDVRSPVPIALTEALQVGGGNTTVDVEADAGDLLNSDPTFHTDIDRSAMDKLPLESQSSSLSSLVTLSSPGIAADSNGLFHGLGDHASNSFSIDGQAITDQQSKVFSNQLPTNAVQSLQVIDGAPPAEFGGKTSVVIDVTTRSGEGITRPTGSVTASFGTFGSANGSVDLSYGGSKWGNFIEVDGLNTGRFLDPPEFTVFHDKGNEFNLFDRVDRQLTAKDSLRFDFNVSRSWFQTPNDYDNVNVQNVLSGGNTANPVLGSVGDADQRSKIVTFNIAPNYTRILNPYAVFNLGLYVRRDGYDYYPSANPLADQSAPNLQNQTISQVRSLLNAGVHSDVSYVKGINNVKIGAQYTQTFLNENDNLSIVSNLFNAPCTDTSGNPVYGYSDPSQCAAAGLVANAGFLPQLLPYDLTRGGGYYNFVGHTDVKELALYIQDQIKLGNWMFNVGIRGDLYNGLAIARQAEPRVGLAYTIKKTGTVLRASYARTLESPFNENLILSSLGCGSDVLAPLLLCSSNLSTTLEPGFRNEFHAGIQQAFGKHFTTGGEYIWKYTHNAFDFSVLGNTPITFPIDWHNSKIPGFALRNEVPEWHGFSAFNVMSSVAARFFPPQVAGAGATVAQGTAANYAFRIDHDEKFNQTTHIQYKVRGEHAPWLGFNWRYDSGLVAGSAPCYPNPNDPNSTCGGAATTLNGQPAIDLSGFTADEEFQAGLNCDGVKATPTTPIPGQICEASQLTSKLISIPAPGTENNDKNPQRIAARNVFDMSVGDDDLFGFNKDQQKISLRLTAVNFTNKYALYNFLSTFSGTHYLTPRALTAEIGYHF
jgi:hypothetical protein